MKLKDIATMEIIQEYIEENLTKDIIVNDLCSLFSIDRNKLQTLFKTHWGDTVNEYIIKQRMYYVADKLINTDDSIRKIASELAGNRVNLYKQFKRTFNCLPNQYRQRMRPTSTPSFVPRTPQPESREQMSVPSYLPNN